LNQGEKKVTDRLLLGIDIGTQGAKVLAVNTTGEILATGHHSYDFDVPHTGWAEQNPLQWWDGVIKSLQQIWEKGINPKDIQAIGVSGQMHSLVLLDENKQELGTSILWNDVRTENECHDMEQIIGKDKILSITRNSVLPGFTAPKLLWIKKHEPERYRLIRHMMQPKDYIVFKLSGELSSDVTDASGTSLFDVQKREWSKEIIDALDIPFEWLSYVQESQTVVGYVSQSASSLTGLAVGIPVVAGAGDNAAAALGNGIYEEGMGIVSVGTSGTVFVPLKNIPTIADDQLSTLHLFCHCLPDTWHAMGVTLSAGMSLQWFKDTFTDTSYEELLFAVGEVPAGSEGLLYLPYLNGERTPHNDPHAKGVFFGMNYRHTRDHFIRAVLEGVSYSLKDCLELIKKLNIPIETLYVTGGASKSPIWKQILSEVFDRPIMAFEEREGPAFGAALLAGLGTGVWKDPTQFPSFFDKGKETNVNTEHVKIYQQGYEMYQDLYTLLKPLFTKSI
jgi:xylulokinase